MTPLVSILLPVRNGAATLPAALASLAGQTFTDAELVAVDDGSTDASAERIASCRLPFPVRLIRSSTPRGLVPALQAGLAAARGALVARMDADDVCHPERLQRQVARLCAGPELDLVACRVAFGGNRENAAGYARYVDWTNTLLTHEELALARFRESPLAHPSVLFRRTVLEQHGGYRDGDFPEDYELWLRWFEAGVRFAKLPETLLTWNDPPDRLSRSHARYRPAAFYALKADYLARWLAAHNPLHPRIWVVGAGRVTRRRVDFLRARGIEVEAYLDLDPRKIGRRHHGAPVLQHDQVPPPGRAFVVPYVSSPGAADYLAQFLAARGYVRGRDFIEAA